MSTAVDIAGAGAPELRLAHLARLIQEKGWKPYPKLLIEKFVFHNNELSFVGAFGVVIGPLIMLLASMFCNGLWAELKWFVVAQAFMAAGMLWTLACMSITQGPVVLVGLFCVVCGLLGNVTTFAMLTQLDDPRFGHNQHAVDDGETLEYGPFARQLLRVRVVVVCVGLVGFATVAFRTIQRVVFPIFDYANYVLFGAFCFLLGLLNIQLATWQAHIAASPSLGGDPRWVDCHMRIASLNHSSNGGCSAVIRAARRSARSTAATARRSPRRRC